jgi:hypothetical protein
MALRERERESGEGGYDCQRRGALPVRPERAATGEMLRVVTSAENVQRRSPFKSGGGSSGGGTRSLGGVLERDAVLTRRVDAAMLMRVAAGEARTRIAVGAVRVWGPPARHAARAIRGVVDEVTGRRR